MPISDFVYTLRSLRRAPEFAIATVMTIALGICATAIVFGHADNVLFKALPLPDSERLIAITSVGPGGVSSERGVHGRHLDLLEGHAFSSLEQVAAMTPFSGLFSARDYSQPLEGEMVSGKYFDFLHVTPRLGRLLGSSDDVKGAQPVIVISEHVWRSTFNADPDIVGQSVRLRGQSLTVVGVSPQSFRGVVFGNFIARDYWIPRSTLDLFAARLGAREREAEQNREYAVLGRLRTGSGRGAAAAEIGALSSVLPAGERLNTARPSRVLAPPPVLRVAGLVLLALSGVLLLIAALNVTILLLARAEARSGEVAVRVMNGATRTHITRLVTLEVVTLVVSGGVIGMLTAGVLLRRIGSLPLWIKFHTFRYDTAPDAPFVVFGCLLIALVIVAVARKPARIAGEVEPLWLVAARTAHHSPDLEHARFKRRLVVGQIAGATVLMTWAAVFGRAAYGGSFGEEYGDPPGVITGEFHMGYFTSDRTVGMTIYRNIASAAASTPGVSEWALASALPFEDSGRAQVWLAEGANPGLLGAGSYCRTVAVAGDVFNALGIAIVKGDTRRLVAPASQEPIAVVNESAADTLWPGEEAVGRRIRLYSPGERTTWIPVVAVVRDTVSRLAGGAARRIVYIPSAAKYDPAGVVILRGSAPPAQIAREFRRALHVVAPMADVYHLRSLREAIAARQAGMRAAATTLGLLAAIGVLVALSGAYATVAYEVRQRARDIAVRKALGATNAQIYRQIVLSKLRVIAGAIGLGGLGALLSTSSVLGAVRMGIPVWDPSLFAAVLLLLFAVCITACLVPATRATRADPMRFLKEC